MTNDHTMKDIPFVLDAKCDRVRVRDVALRVFNDELKDPAEAGKCRFCGRLMPFTHVKLELPPAGTIEYPVLQCGRVAKLYDEAVREADRMRKEMYERLNQKRQDKAKDKYEF